MTTAEKLDILTGLIARKDLSFGCLIKQHTHIKKISYYLGDESDEDSCMGHRYFHVYDIRKESPYGQSPHTYSDDFRLKNEINEIKEIIGHPVLLSDVLVWLEKNKMPVGVNGVGLIEIYAYKFIIRDLTKPYLSEQSEKVINGLYEVALLISK